MAEQVLIKLPILLCCEGTFFRAHTVERANLEMEVIDVRNGSWRAYDSDGVRLNIVIKKTAHVSWRRPARERAFIEAPDHCETESDFADKLRDHLKEMRAHGAELDSYSLSELLPLVPEL